MFNLFSIRDIMFILRNQNSDSFPAKANPIFAGMNLYGSSLDANCLYCTEKDGGLATLIDPRCK